MEIFLINPNGGRIVFHARSKRQLAEFLGVSPKTVYRAKSYIKGYYIAEVNPSHWEVGYTLKEKEIELLGIAPTEPATPSCKCGRQFSICPVCSGGYKDIFGKYIRVRGYRIVESTDIETGEVSIYTSLDKAAESTGRSFATAKSKIHKVAMGKARSYLGKIWRYKNNGKS